MAACPACGKELPGEFPFCPHCAAPLTSESREQRKTVTVLFCDVTGSTALGESTDPEALRALLARYFERMKAIVESHGGTVEKFIGDAVMAVFGVPVAHEDDALRACRAAVEMREALPDLGIRGRIGVNTGEVVTGTAERLVTGDAVNVAARLEQAASPDEILIGESTFGLVERAVEAEPVEPLELKGKEQAVPALRLVRMGEAPKRLHGDVFVGRERELDEIAAAWVRAGVDQRCELVTVVAEAGVGKTRLAAEAIDQLEARVVRGRCLSYGEGITYWPVVEVVKQLGVRPSDPVAAVAIASLLGETDAGSSGEEIAWAFRKLLEEQAPLVCVFEDVHWGEETFLDLVEHVALLSAGAQVLLLCTARPELLERRHTWPVRLHLAPLDPVDVDQLLPVWLSPEFREQIVRACGGNPLFVTEMVAMAANAGSEVSVPPTLRALLTARLDQVDVAERRVLERGAVEGEVFHRGAVQALAPDEPQVTARLAALVRRELVRPDRALISGDDGFRFRHLLIRDVAYEAVPKAARAELHERFATWLEQHGGELVELDEIVGYHLEQAYLYRRELGLEEDAGLAARARQRLAAGGLRAARYQDYHAAVSLLERAVVLVPGEGMALALEVELGDALVWVGKTSEALQRADTFTEWATARGDRLGELCGRIRGGSLRLILGEVAVEQLAGLVEQALTEFQEAGDDLALFIAYVTHADIEWSRGRNDSALQAYERAISHAQRAGHHPVGSLGTRAAFRFFGSTGASEMLAWLDENEPQTGRDYFLRAYRAGSLAMLGRFDEARTILAEDRVELKQRGGGLLLANITAFESVWVELWAGDPAAAVQFGEEGWRLQVGAVESFGLSLAAGTLSRSLYELDRLDEAEAWADRAAELARGQPWDEILQRQVRAKLRARRGDHAEAERLAWEAVTICDQTERSDLQGDVYADLAEVMLLAGKTEDAAAALEQALDRYRRKENLAMVKQVRPRLNALQRESSGQGPLHAP